MPEYVTKDGTWNDVRVGDMVEGTVVKDIIKKQKFAFVTMDLADQVRPWRRPLAEPITYERTEATQAERNASRVQFRFEMMRDALTDMLDSTPMKKLEQVMAKARHTSTEDGDLAYDVLTHWALDDVLRTQARYKVALRIRSYLAWPLEDATYDDLLTAYAKWWSYERDNMRHASRDPLSRSTSVTSNLLEDLDEWAVQSVTSGFGWSEIQDEMDARANEILAERRKS
jgi:hypothetical protein